MSKREVGKPLPLTPYDQARSQMTQAEYKAWVETGVWPERIPYPKAKYQPCPDCNDSGRDCDIHA